MPRTTQTHLPCGSSVVCIPAPAGGFYCGCGGCSKCRGASSVSLVNRGSNRRRGSGIDKASIVAGVKRAVRRGGHRRMLAFANVAGDDGNGDDGNGGNGGSSATQQATVIPGETVRSPLAGIRLQDVDLDRLQKLMFPPGTGQTKDERIRRARDRAIHKLREHADRRIGTDEADEVQLFSDGSHPPLIQAGHVVAFVRSEGQFFVFPAVKGGWDRRRPLPELMRDRERRLTLSPLSPKDIELLVREATGDGETVAFMEHVGINAEPEAGADHQLANRSRPSPRRKSMALLPHERTNIQIRAREQQLIANHKRTGRLR